MESKQRHFGSSSAVAYANFFLVTAEIFFVRLKTETTRSVAQSGKGPILPKRPDAERSQTSFHPPWRIFCLAQNFFFLCVSLFLLLFVFSPMLLLSLSHSLTHSLTLFLALSLSLHPLLKPPSLSLSVSSFLTLSLSLFRSPQFF